LSLLSKRNDNDQQSISNEKQSEKNEQPKKVIKKLNDVSNQLSVNEPRAKKVAKKKPNINNNFHRLQMRKKRFYMNQKQSRFRNSKRNKYKQYRANKINAKFDNKCYKCGSSDHIEEECVNIPSLAVQFDEDSTGDGAHDTSFDESFDLGLQKGLYDDPNDHEVNDTLDKNFLAFCSKSIRSEQRETIRRLICGRSCLLIAPTGFGKSICYQVAAYCYWQRFHSITIVISPLISLMQDQIRNLPEQLRGVCINSNQSEREKANAIADIIEYRAQILFLSPECLVNGLHSIPFKSFPKIAFVCIDEAHCIATWSTNFRPSFLQLYESIRTKLNVRIVLALTATATQEMIENICENLDIDRKNDVVGHTEIPENLSLTVIKSSSNKMLTVVNLLKQKTLVNSKSIIIYCTRRNDCEQLASYIRTSLQFEKDFRQTESFAECYHAGLSSQQRRDIQRRFLNDQLRIVVATIAFGMGINKKNVGAVIHYDMPKSFENYVQEIGRAGRNMLPAFCHIILDDDYCDLYTLQNFIYANGVDRENISKFLHLVYEKCHCRHYISKLIANDDILRHADIILQRRRPALWNRNSNFTFSIADVARLMNKDVWYIRNHLKKIQRKHRRQLGIRFSDYSFHFDAPGIFSGKQLDRIIDCVYDRMMKFERQELAKLRFTYQKFSEFRSNGKDNEKFSEKSDGLKAFLNNVYFGSRSITEEIEHSLSELDGKSNNALPSMLAMRKDDYAAICYKITEFIQQYYDQGLDSERKIARILAGISSPKYSADIWGRVRQFWRSLVHVDFEFLLKLSQKCLADHRSNEN
ncbi:ATP-dependent DNA helicase Q4-like protein, partial [Euroglyphus maynei]